MPVQSVWMIRMSLVYFLSVITIGGFLLSSKGFLGDISIWTLLEVHIELALFGWLIQFVLGTAYWILPRYLEGAKRGNEKLAWLMIVLLNSGLWIYILTHLQVLPTPGIVTGRILELAAIALFIYLHWHRIVDYQRGH